MINAELPERFTCSRAECHATAVWQLTWSNPAIHHDGRTKNWLACDEHLDFLRQFLTLREFPLTVNALALRIPT